MAIKRYGSGWGGGENWSSIFSEYWLTHWGWVTHICIGKLTIIASDNGLSPGQCQAIIWTNAGILLIGPLGTKFNEILIEIHTFSFKKMHLKMTSAKWRSFCLGPNVLMLFLILPQTISDEVGNKVKLYSLLYFIFFKRKCSKITKKFIHFHSRKCTWNVVCEVAFILSWPQCVNAISYSPSNYFRWSRKQS